MKIVQIILLKWACGAQVCYQLDLLERDHQLRSMMSKIPLVYHLDILKPKSVEAVKPVAVSYVPAEGLVWFQPIAQIDCPLKFEEMSESLQQRFTEDKEFLASEWVDRIIRDSDLSAMMLDKLYNDEPITFTSTNLDVLTDSMPLVVAAMNGYTDQPDRTNIFAGTLLNHVHTMMSSGKPLSVQLSQSMHTQGVVKWKIIVTNTRTDEVVMVASNKRFDYHSTRNAKKPELEDSMLATQVQNCVLHLKSMDLIDMDRRQCDFGSQLYAYKIQSTGHLVYTYESKP